jgi:uncharacterized protein YjbJ (UPF0337 family)
MFHSEVRRIIMNKDIIQGKWHEIKGAIRQKWGKITDDDIAQMKGSYEELQGILQKRYGSNKEDSRDQIDEFLEENEWSEEEED